MSRPRVARFILLGPPPFGGVRATTDRADLARSLAAGWRITRVRMLPTDPARLAELVAAYRNGGAA